MAKVPLISNKLELIDGITGNLTVGGKLTTDSDTPYAKQSPTMYTLPMYTYQAPNSSYYNRYVRLGRFTTTSDPELVCEVIKQGDFNYSNQTIHSRINAHIWAGSTANINISITNLTPFGYHPGWAMDSNRNLYYHDSLLWTQRVYLMVYSAVGFEIDIESFSLHDTSLTFRYLTSATYSFEGAY